MSPTLTRVSAPADTGSVLLSPDDVSGSPSEAWAQCHRRLRELLRQPWVRLVVVTVGPPGAGKTTWARALLESKPTGLVVFDACWTQMGRRRGLARQIARAGKRSVLVRVVTPLAVCRARNAQRTPDRRVQDAAVVRCWTRLRQHPPRRSEGWGRVVRVSGELGFDEQPPLT